MFVTGGRADDPLSFRRRQQFCCCLVKAVVDLAGIDQIVALASAEIDAVPVVAIEDVAIAAFVAIGKVLKEEWDISHLSVGFRDGNVRVVYPDDDDPLRYHQQIIASEAKGFEVLPPESDLPT